MILWVYIDPILPVQKSCWFCLIFPCKKCSKPGVMPGFLLWVRIPKKSGDNQPSHDL